MATELKLPDPGEGRYWNLRSDGTLALMSNNFSDSWDSEINQTWLSDFNETKVWIIAQDMVRRADAAGNYFYEQGKQVKK